MLSDPIDPGALPSTTVGLTSRQVQQLIAAVEHHRGSVRIEALRDAHARVVLIGPEGEPVNEKLLWPT